MMKRLDCNESLGKVWGEMNSSILERVTPSIPMSRAQLEIVLLWKDKGSQGSEKPKMSKSQEGIVKADESNERISCQCRL